MAFGQMQMFLAVSQALFHAWLASAQCTPHNSLAFRSPVTSATGLKAVPIFGNLTTPRGIAFDSQENLLVIERGLGVSAFSDKETECDGWFRSVIVQNANLTQGIQVDPAGEWLYVSTSGEVLRFPYNASEREVTGQPEVIVQGIPPDGGQLFKEYA
jgi:glucose/arabinose dehydrogenase